MFDFERWTPVWWGGLLGEAYQNLSLTLVRQRHPSWDANRTLAQAKTEFVSQALPTRVIVVFPHLNRWRVGGGWHGVLRGVPPRLQSPAPAGALGLVRPCRV